MGLAELTIFNLWKIARNSVIMLERNDEGIKNLVLLKNIFAFSFKEDMFFINILILFHPVRVLLWSHYAYLT